MTATDSSGGEIGAPLGTYLGLDLTPQDDQRRSRRWALHPVRRDEAGLALPEPTGHTSNGSRRRRTASYSAESFSKEDAKAYIREATHSTIGKNK